jgi:carboxypeptidase C (cathepsin A)
MSDAPKKDAPVVVVSTAGDLARLTGKAPPKPPEHEDRRVVTQHTLTVGDRTLAYTATTGTMRVQLDDKPAVDLFFVAYTLDGAGTERPVTFAFNGGPGSSSVWLHLGLFGPHRVRVDVDRPAAVPGHLEPNPHTLLTQTDLVFIDPTSTGHSRPVEGKGREYHGVDADIESVAILIRQWLSEHGRWGSPRYLAGESYGTIRAVGIARHLQERWCVDLNGLILVSVALKLGTLLFDAADNWLASVMLLPAAAVTGHYHGRVEADDVLELHARAERFATEVYAPELIKGARATPEERQALSAELSALTGASAAFFDRCDNHLDLARFCAELRRDERLVVGRLDSRFTGSDRDAQAENLTEDPSFTAVQGVFTTGLYLQLAANGYDEKRSYRIFNPDVWPWTFDDTENKPLDLTRALGATLRRNPAQRVFVASGLYDLATPWAATEYTLAHLQIPATLRDNLESHVYPAGHMMYLHEPSATALRADLAAFYGS